MEIMMKKTLVAVGVIVAVGAIWTGASWYLGKQIEQNIGQVVEQANQNLSQQAAHLGLVVSYDHYQRGLFQSQLQLVIKGQPGVANALLGKDQSIVMNETITHGPFPQLQQFNFMPGLAAVESTLEKTTFTQPMFELTHGASPFDAVTRVSFDGSTASKIHLVPLNVKQGDEQLNFSGATVRVDVDGQGDHIVYKANADSGSLTTLNAQQQTVKAGFSGLNLNGDTRLSLQALRTGSQSVAVKTLALSVNDKEVAQATDLSLNGQTDLSADKKKITLNADYRLKGLSIEQQNLGSGAIALHLANLDADALAAVIKNYQDASRQLLADPDVVADPVKYQQAFAAILAQQLPLLLKGDPSLTFGPVSWKNSQGESTFTTQIQFKDPAGQSEPVINAEQLIGQFINTLDARLVIPVPMATELMTQIALIEGYSAEDAQKLADQQVKGFAAMGQMFHVTHVENDAITASLGFKNGQATLNGDAINLNDLLGLLVAPAEAE